MASVIRGSDNFDSADRGVAVADQWRLTTSVTTSTTITAWEQTDDPLSANIGPDLTVSSGIFSFPVTGLYQVYFIGKWTNTSNDNVIIEIDASSDSGASWDVIAHASIGGSGIKDKSSSASAFVNVSSLSTKVRLRTTSISSGSSLKGDSSNNTTAVTFIKLGAAQ
jgi:hypothetical protein